MADGERARRVRQRVADDSSSSGEEDVSVSGDSPAANESIQHASESDDHDSSEEEGYFSEAEGGAVHSDEGDGNSAASGLPVTNDEFLEHELDTIADMNDLVRRPVTQNRTNINSRHLVITREERARLIDIKNLILHLRSEDSPGEEPSELEFNLIQEAVGLQYMPPTMRVRKSTIPCFCSVDEAFRILGENRYLFSQIFGFHPDEVKEMASVLFYTDDKVLIHKTKYPREECMLVVLARMKLTLATFELMAYHFQRSTSTLVTIFAESVRILLEEYSCLISVEYLNRFGSIVPLCQEKMLHRYRTTLGDLHANFPKRYRGVGAFMDGSKFMISRPSAPGNARSSDVQRSFYNGKGNAHFLNVLCIVIPSGLRVAAVIGSGRHADPFLVSERMKEELRRIGLPVLGDAIFGQDDVIRGLEKLSQTTISAVKSVGMSAVRIPVEWSFLEIKQSWALTTTFTKLKLFQTRPKAIIEMATLLTNFKLCFRGSNATTYFHMLPPTFEQYVRFKVSRD